MDAFTPSFALTGVVPSVCDAEAGQARHRRIVLAKLNSIDGNGSSMELSPNPLAVAQEESVSRYGVPMRRLRSVIAELCAAIRSALDDERVTAEDSLRRAAEILHEIGEADAPARESAMEPVKGGLAPWQIRKVASHVDAHLGRPIRNEDLAAIARLNPSHFGRAFRTSFGEPPHEYVIRRRVERAQGLMLSTGASLSEIALDCGLADQSHLTRLFRRIVGESPSAWRRARIAAPV